MEKELRMFPITFTETCFKNLYSCYCVCSLTKTLINVLQFVINFIINASDKGETKTILVLLSLVLLLAQSFSIQQAHTQNKMGHSSDLKSKGPCENDYKKYCLNSGECYYQVDEDSIGCNCIKMNGKNRH